MTRSSALELLPQMGDSAKIESFDEAKWPDDEKATLLILANTNVQLVDLSSTCSKPFFDLAQPHKHHKQMQLVLSICCLPSVKIS